VRDGDDFTALCKHRSHKFKLELSAKSFASTIAT